MGRMNSMPAASAVCASASISLHSARQRFSTLVKAVPPSALIENNPSLNRFAFIIGLVERVVIGLLYFRPHNNHGMDAASLDRQNRRAEQRVAPLERASIMRFPRRRFLQLTSAAVALPALSRPAWTQTFPSRPITIVVAYAAGGTTDIIARVM